MNAEERWTLVPFPHLDEERPISPAACKRASEQLHGRRLLHDCKRGLAFRKRFANPEDKSNRKERVASQFEEVIMDSNSRNSQNVGPDPSQHLLDGVVRSVESVRGWKLWLGELERQQSFIVYLAIW